VLVCAQVSAYEIQTQQLQTILNKRANDSRAAGQATNEVVAQVSVCPLCCLCSHLSCPFCLFIKWQEGVGTWQEQLAGMPVNYYHYYQMTSKLLSCCEIIS